MEYILTIQIRFPLRVEKVLKQEKNRFVKIYGSGYRSEPHITLYLGRYTKPGFHKLIPALQKIEEKRFTISLQKPESVIKKKGRKFFFVGIANNKKLSLLHKKVLSAARVKFVTRN